MDRGTKVRENCELHNYLKLSSLSPSSLPVISVKTSKSNQKTLSSPEGLLSLSVSILYSKKLNLKAWNKEHHQCSRCSALLMYTQACGWYTVICDHAGPRSTTCYFNYSRGKDRKSHTAHSLHLTALHQWHPGPSHCLRLCDLHNQTQNPNEGDCSLIIDLITIFLYSSLQLISGENNFSKCRIFLFHDFRIKKGKQKARKANTICKSLLGQPQWEAQLQTSQLRRITIQRENKHAVGTCPTSCLLILHPSSLPRSNNCQIHLAQVSKMGHNSLQACPWPFKEKK